MDFAPLNMTGDLDEVMTNICTLAHFAAVNLSRMENIYHLASPKMQVALRVTSYYEGRLHDVLYQLYLTYRQHYEHGNVVALLVHHPHQAVIELSPGESRYDNSAVRGNRPAVFRRCMTIRALYVASGEGDENVGEDPCLFSYKKFLTRYRECIPYHIFSKIQNAPSERKLVRYLVANSI